MLGGNAARVYGFDAEKLAPLVARIGPEKTRVRLEGETRWPELRYVRSARADQAGAGDEPRVPAEHGALDPLRLRDRPEDRARARAEAARARRAARGLRDLLARRDAPHARAHARDRLGDLRRARASTTASPGIFLLTMPMTTEQAVIGGRETYGEPKKIAQIEFAKDGDRVAAKVSRMGMTYLSVSGTRRRGARRARVRRVRLLREGVAVLRPGARARRRPAAGAARVAPHAHAAPGRSRAARSCSRESPFDPVADVPVRRLVRCEYEEGGSQSNGRVLRSIPGDWFLPFLHGRYDDAVGRRDRGLRDAT